MSKHSFLGKLLKEMEDQNKDKDQTQKTSSTLIGDTNHISNILDNQLYLGSQYSTIDDTIIKRNITHIISIGCGPLYNHNDTTINIRNYKFDIEDNGDKDNVNTFFTKIIPEIHKIINILLNDNKKILVHCQAGMSRSAIVIITWLMKYKNMDYDTAFKYVKERRPVISPNMSFIDYIKSTSI